MSHKSSEGPLTVAIVGSGPSGFYTCEALLKADRDLRINIFERLPAPYGLVRYGVAPDHPKLKQVCDLFRAMGANERVSFYGNVEIGKDLSVAELLAWHHAVVICNGAGRDRQLGVPGENLSGSHPAIDFVGWYNGHPDAATRRFDLSANAAVIVGQGNVALDICRMLMKPLSELKHTDISEQALACLAKSRVREVHIVGRRGPVQSKFTIKELREICSIENCVVQVFERTVLESEDLTEMHVPANTNARQCTERFDAMPIYSREAPASRRIIFHFQASPIEIQGEGEVKSVLLARHRLVGSPFNRRPEPTGGQYQIDCGICIRSIGQLSAELDSLPYRPAMGTLSNVGGRITNEQGQILPGLYTSGWAKRGASGVIGSNRADSLESVNALLSDAGRLRSRHLAGSVSERLSARGIDYVAFDRWLRIDLAEVSAGARADKPRAKLLSVREMLSVK